jgi:hypothetical protein
VNILRGIARQILQAEPGRRGQERNAPGTAEQREQPAEQREQPSSESAVRHDGQAE